MPLHAWGRVHPDIFHSFHLGWVVTLHHHLNQGGLPSDHDALTEQHAGHEWEGILARPPAPVAPARDAARRSPDEPLRIARRRSPAIRHVSHHRLVALIEIVSPANKDRPGHVAEFADKVGSALEANVHVSVVDLFPPGRHDPAGMHGAVMLRLARADEPPGDPDDRPPAGEPLTLAAYAAGRLVDAYLE